MLKKLQCRAKGEDKQHFLLGVKQGPKLVDSVKRYQTQILSVLGQVYSQEIIPMFLKLHTHRLT